MHRFYLPPSQCQENFLFLAGPEAHHALHVLRVRRAERVLILDGVGNEYLCDVQDYDRDKVRLKLAEKRCVSPLPYEVTLVQAVPKGKIMESIIQKATELGASRVVPLLSERVVVNLDKKDPMQKGAKWRSVAVEAIKQCGSPWLPSVTDPLTLDEFFRKKESFELSLVGSLQPGSKHPREYFRAFHAQTGRHPKSLCLWVGPEGDFSPRELDAIKTDGALPITLGRLVLRSETAAVYCLAIANHELQSPSPRD